MEFRYRTSTIIKYYALVYNSKTSGEFNLLNGITLPMIYYLYTFNFLLLLRLDHIITV